MMKLLRKPNHCGEVAIDKRFTVVIENRTECVGRELMNDLVIASLAHHAARPKETMPIYFGALLDKGAMDDPTIKAVASPLAGRYPFTEMVPQTVNADSLARHDDLLGQIFDEGWVAKMDRFGIDEEPSRIGCRSCEWLYQNITIDSSARLMPCCMAPTTTPRHLVFGSLDNDEGDAINTRDYRLARMAFVDRASFEQETNGSKQQPFCAECPSSPGQPFGRESDLPTSLAHLDMGVLLDSDSVAALTKQVPIRESTTFEVSNAD